MRHFLLSIVVALAGVGSAAASNDLLTKSTPQEVFTFHSDLLQQLSGHGVEGLRRGEEKKLVQHATLTTKLLTGVQNWGDLGQEDQLQVFNLNEDVRELLASADERGKQQVCTREKVLGSNMPKVVCRTRAELEREKLSAKEGFRQMQEKHPGKPNS
jgi:hypothetical protein